MPSRRGAESGKTLSRGRPAELARLLQGSNPLKNATYVSHSPTRDPHHSKQRRLRRVSRTCVAGSVPAIRATRQATHEN
jgi:hypothetical protein